MAVFHHLLRAGTLILAQTNLPAADSQQRESTELPEQRNFPRPAGEAKPIYLPEERFSQKQ